MRSTPAGAHSPQKVTGSKSSARITPSSPSNPGTDFHWGRRQRRQPAGIVPSQDDDLPTVPRLRRRRPLHQFAEDGHMLQLPGTAVVELGLELREQRCGGGEPILPGLLGEGRRGGSVNALGAFAVLRVANEPPVVGQGVAGQGRDSSPCSLVPVYM